MGRHLRARLRVLHLHPVVRRGTLPSPHGLDGATIEVGDQVLAQKVTINLGMGVNQGDIVVFRNPDGASDHDILVKRVIATAGQTVDLQAAWCT